MDALGELEPFSTDWIEANRDWRGQWVERMVTEIPELEDGAIHPLQLAPDDFYSLVDHHFHSGKLGGLRLCARRREEP